MGRTKLDKTGELSGLPRMFSVKDMAAYFQLSEQSIIMRCKKAPHTMPPSINIGTVGRPIFRFPADDVKSFVKYMLTQRGTNVPYTDKLPDVHEVIVQDDDELFDLPISEGVDAK